MTTAVLLAAFDVNEFVDAPQFQAVIQNPVAAATWLVLTLVALAAAKWSARAGYHGAKWARRRAAAAFSAPELSPRAQSITDKLVADPAKWSTGELPLRAVQRLKAPGSELRIVIDDKTGTVSVQIDQKDALYGLAKREAKLIKARAGALLGVLTAALLEAKLDPVPAVAGPPAAADESQGAGSGKLTVIGQLTARAHNGITWTVGRVSEEWRRHNVIAGGDCHVYAVAYFGTTGRCYIPVMLRCSREFAESLKVVNALGVEQQLVVASVHSGCDVLS